MPGNFCVCRLNSAFVGFIVCFTVIYTLCLSVICIFPVIFCVCRLYSAFVCDIMCLSVILCVCHLYSVGFFWLYSVFVCYIICVSIILSVNRLYSGFVSYIICVCRLYCVFFCYTMCLSITLSVFQLYYHFHSVFRDKRCLHRLWLKKGFTEHFNDFNYTCSVFLIHSCNKIFFF